MNNNKEVILFIFEGENIEKQILENLLSLFFCSKTKIYPVFWCGNIHELYNEIKKDSYIEVIDILKERISQKRENKQSKNSADISKINRVDISEIHLFFDYDLQGKDKQNQLLYHNEIVEMLRFFNNETDKGKLWISYPMAEALKHFKKDINKNNIKCVYDISDINNKISYKNFISKITDYQDIRKLKKEDWFYLSALTVQKLWCLVENECKIPDYKDLKDIFNTASIENQKKQFDLNILIQEKQYYNFVENQSKVVTLSPFPIFLIYYFGYKFYNNIINKPIKNCKFKCVNY